jgi:hypothetical protein
MGRKVKPLHKTLSTEKGFWTNIRDGYGEDTLFSKILENPGHHPKFQLKNELIYLERGLEPSVLCIPRSIHNGHRVTETIIDQGHRTVGHLGTNKTANYIAKSYWWPTLHKDVYKFCKSCGTCQSSKDSTKRPRGLLHSLPIPGRPWESIGMDFIGPLPETKEGWNFLWVIICRLSSMVHLVPIPISTRASELANRYIQEVIRLHGIPHSIVSDRDPRFTSKFWKEIQRQLGTKLMMSTAFHPQTDRSTERVNRVIDGILRAVISPDQSDWASKIPMVEFAINSSQSSTTGLAPFEINYGYLPTLRGLLDEVPHTVKPGIRAYADKARQHLMEAHDAIISA